MSDHSPGLWPHNQHHIFLIMEKYISGFVENWGYFFQAPSAAPPEKLSASISHVTRDARSPLHLTTSDPQIPRTHHLRVHPVQDPLHLGLRNPAPQQLVHQHEYARPDLTLQSSSLDVSCVSCVSYHSYHSYQKVSIRCAAYH